MTILNAKIPYHNNGEIQVANSSSIFFNYKGKVTQ